MRKSCIFLFCSTNSSSFGRGKTLKCVTNLCYVELEAEPSVQIFLHEDSALFVPPVNFLPLIQGGPLQIQRFASQFFVLIGDQLHSAGKTLILKLAVNDALYCFESPLDIGRGRFSFFRKDAN
jgi:hypothetical protein